MSVGKRLSEERKRIGLNKTEFGKIGGIITKTSQLNYEKCNSSSTVACWQAIASAGADVHYILTGETKRDQLIAAVQASTEKWPDWH